MMVGPDDDDDSINSTTLSQFLQQMYLSCNKKSITAYSVKSIVSR